MTPIDLTTLIPRCHEAAKAKGFWDVLPNPGQMLMLAIGELGEAQEADRKGARADVARMKEYQDAAPKWADKNGVYANAFKAAVKDTLEDELADTYIRLCDYAGGYQIDLSQWVAERHTTLRLLAEHPEAVPVNFGEALLPIVKDILDVNTARKLESSLALSSALLKLELLCKARGIDLATHIELKLAYNATRPVRHGKNY